MTDSPNVPLEEAILCDVIAENYRRRIASDTGGSDLVFSRTSRMAVTPNQTIATPLSILAVSNL